MRQPLVIDASVLVPYALPDADDLDIGGLDDAFADPGTDVIAPPFVDLEVVNVGARRRGLDERSLLAIVEQLERLPMTRIDPELPGIARWAAFGLSAYDATYAALAEQLDARLLTQDADLLLALPDRAIRSFSP